MSNTTASDRIRDYALKQVDKPYIMGATAQICTPKYRKARAAQYPDYADNIYKYCPVLNGERTSCSGCKWEGEEAFDCSQLVLHALEAAGITLPSGATSQWREGNWYITGEISDMPMDVVCCVYHKKSGTADRMSHTGVYLGDGTVVDARGHQSGVKHEDVSDYPWTHYAIPAEVAQEVELDLHDHTTYADVRRPTIRKGSRGEYVREAQALLRALVEPELEIDGIFGSATEAAVKIFQLVNRLTVDGVIGPKTWAALIGMDYDAGDDDADSGATLTPEDSAPDTAALMAAVDKAMADLKAAVSDLVNGVVKGGG